MKDCSYPGRRVGFRVIESKRVVVVARHHGDETTVGKLRETHDAGATPQDIAVGDPDQVVRIADVVEHDFGIVAIATVSVSDGEIVSGRLQRTNMFVTTQRADLVVEVVHLDPIMRPWRRIRDGGIRPQPVAPHPMAR